MIAGQLGCPASHVAQHPHRGGDVEAGAGGPGLAVVDRFELGELVGIGLDQIGELHQDAFAPGRRDAAPAAVVEGGARGGDCAVDVLIGSVGDTRDLAPGRRIVDRDRPVV
jgi:hypothetical protein